PAAITVSPVDAQGRVAIRGALAASKGETVGALINRGSHGVEPCTVVRPAPTFELACTLAPEDEQAWIEIYAQPPQHLLSSSLARALAHRRGTSAIAFPTLERSAAVADPASFRVALLAELNQIRTAGGLPPLTLAPVQSTSLDPVAPHIIAALRTKDENRLDQLVLGVAAGWDVQGGVIRDANVSSSFSGHRDARGWLANAGEQPLTRNVLFDPKADQLAVGTAFDTPLPGVSTVVATYQIYDPSELAADTEAAFAALNRARAERGVAPAIRIPDAPELERAALSIPQGTHPEDALQQALEAMSRRHGRQVQGSISLTVSPKETAFPPELLMLPAASVAIRLVHHHLPDSRWGFFIVLIAVDPSAPSQRMAAGPSERRGL
ncbi:MAG: hypothetical protein KC731_08460, partial [Myxococcales bacterium]|nr:hypothetical protein [Myxococcales bacterium]